MGNKEGRKRNDGQPSPPKQAYPEHRFLLLLGIVATALGNRHILSTMIRIAARHGGRSLLPAERVRWQAHLPSRFSSEPRLVRYQSTTDDSRETSKASLKDTVNRIQQEKKEESASAATDSTNNLLDSLLPKLAQYYDSFKSEVNLAWTDLVNSGQRKDINKKIHPVATPEGDTPYTGPVEIMVIDPTENLTAWERMQKRLTEAPIIAEVLQRTELVYEKSGARKVKERLEDIKDDAKEVWETSQNPWVYRVSSVYDTLTAESPETMAVKELRKLDPEFTLEDWREDVVEHTLPNIMKWLLEGRINQLKPWLGEGVFKRIAAEIKAREQEGVEIDTHVLGIMNSEILACEVRALGRISTVS